MTVPISGHTCVLADNVKETSTTTGTGTYELNGADAGAVSFATGVGIGNKTPYRAQSGTSWEIGIGTVSSATALARTEILESSNGGNAVSWTGTTIDIFVTAPAALLDQIFVEPAAPTLPELRTVQDTTSGTQITFTSIDADARQIKVMFRNVSTTGVSPIIVQLGDSGGIETTGYTGAVVQVSASAQQVLNFSTGFAIHNAAVAARTYSGHVLLNAFDDDGLAWIASIVIGQDQDAGHYGGGFKSLSGRLTQVRITSESGANVFDVGGINIHVSE